ncbi:hypothetical protein GCM10007941_03630 [Amphritea balenae]|nr:hypothetical protein GCM10007941_03630 [Amphritea balenae]
MSFIIQLYWFDVIWQNFSCVIGMINMLKHSYYSPDQFRAVVLVINTDGDKGESSQSSTDIEC